MVNLRKEKDFWQCTKIQYPRSTDIESNRKAVELPIRTTAIEDDL